MGARAALVLLALAPALLALWVLWLAPLADPGAWRPALAMRDFTALWAAGKLALAGQWSSLYDSSAFSAALRAWFGAGMPDQIWPYPPPIALLAAPLAALPIVAAFVLYTAAGPVLLWLAMRPRAVPVAIRAVVLLSPAMADNALVGQNGAWTGALLIGGLLRIDSRPILAGALFGLLALKPQMGVLLPLCLIAGRRWRCLAASALSAALVVLAAAALFGLEAWHGYAALGRPAVSAYYEVPWSSDGAQRMFASAFMAARSLGLTLSVAYAVQVGVTVIAAAAAWCAWTRQHAGPAERVAATLALTCLASPWIHSYDLPALAFAIATLWLSAKRPNPLETALLAFAWWWPGALLVLPIPNVVFLCSLVTIAWIACVRVCHKQPDPQKNRKPMRFVSLSIMAFVFLFQPARTVWSHPDEHACDLAAVQAEQDWNLPAGILSAVGTVESGRRSALGAAPWPYTINAAGKGYFFDTKAEAIAATLSIMERGYPFLDLGCFQIDIAYHAGLFRSLEDAFDPHRNAQEAARLLALLRAAAPDWATAVARYHSATPELGGPYLQRVRAALPFAKTRAAAAQWIAASERAPRPSSAVVGDAVPAQKLPEILYGLPLQPKPINGPQIVTVRHAEPTAPAPTVAAALIEAAPTPH